MRRDGFQGLPGYFRNVHKPVGLALVGRLTSLCRAVWLIGRSPTPVLWCSEIIEVSHREPRLLALNILHR